MKNKPQDNWVKELDSIQRDIWARINECLQRDGVKYGIGAAYGAGSSIKDTLHPRVQKLLAEQRQAVIQSCIEALPEVFLECFFDDWKHGVNSGIKSSRENLEALLTKQASDK
jgi:hypothetical protein